MIGPHIPHASDDCTGEWESAPDHWRCTACGAEHPHSPENDTAAMREYGAGALLRSQTRQGRFPHLFQRRPPEAPTIELPDPDEEEGAWD